MSPGQWGVRSAVRGARWDRRHQLRAEACSWAGTAAGPWGPQGAADRLPQTLACNIKRMVRARLVEMEKAAQGLAETVPAVATP